MPDQDLPGDPQAPFVAVLVDFANELRHAGLLVGSGDVIAYCQAMAPLDPTDLVDLYFAGRATLVSKRDDLAAYDETFRWFFLSENRKLPESLLLKSHTEALIEASVVTGDLDTPGGQETEERQALGLRASNIETLKHKNFPACTPAELVALRRIMRRIKLTPPRRRTRRTMRGRQGRAPDMRRTVRETMRRHGEPAELYFRQRRTRLRPLILILDVSGSMADYSRCLLQFAYSAKRAASRVEVFCFGTRLTRITRTLEHRKPDHALQTASREVVDWDGGTRIGGSLDTFVRRWGRRGLCRGAVVVICSDGLDRGDAGDLSSAMERLSRLCYRLVWMNPHKGTNANYRPASVGMVVAAPYIDLLLSGHDLASLEELAALLPTLN